MKAAALEEGGAGLHLGGLGLTKDGDWPADVLVDEAVAADLGAERAAFFYTAKASQADRSMDGLAPNEHPTVKPQDLMRWLVELVRRPDGQERLLDPFCGSGSTLIAAARAGFRAVGIERDEAYARLAGKRFIADAPLFHLDETPRPSTDRIGTA